MNLVELILFEKSDSNKSISIFEKLIDCIVYELYFPESIKSAGCEVIKYLPALPELNESWEREKKLKTIATLYNDLINPKHPLSISMEKIQEIEEVKIIEGQR